MRSRPQDLPQRIFIFHVDAGYAPERAVVVRLHAGLPNEIGRGERGVALEVLLGWAARIAEYGRERGAFRIVSFEIILDFDRRQIERLEIDQLGRREIFLQHHRGGEIRSSRAFDERRKRILIDAENRFRGIHGRGLQARIAVEVGMEVEEGGERGFVFGDHVAFPIENLAPRRGRFIRLSDIIGGAGRVIGIFYIEAHDLADDEQGDGKNDDTQVNERPIPDGNLRNFNIVAPVVAQRLLKPNRIIMASSFHRLQ